MNKLFPFAFTLLLLTIIPHAHGQYFGVTESSGSKWKAGIQFGYSQLQGDVTVDEFGFHGGAFLQKALGRAMDFRIQFKGGQTQGLNLESSNGFLFNSHGMDGRTPFIFMTVPSPFTTTTNCNFSISRFCSK